MSAKQFEFYDDLSGDRTNVFIRLAVLLAKYFIVPEVHSGIEHSDRQARQESLLHY